MTWNYRLIQYEDDSCGIHEVYYEEDKIVSWTERAVGIVADSREEINKDVERILEEIKKRPVLYLDKRGEIHEDKNFNQSLQSHLNNEINQARINFYPEKPDCLCIKKSILAKWMNANHLLSPPEELYGLKVILLPDSLMKKDFFVTFSSPDYIFQKG